LQLGIRERKEINEGRAGLKRCNPAHQSNVECSFGKEEKKRAGGGVTAEL
jgi:Zn-finger domain-containing protein